MLNKKVVGISVQNLHINPQNFQQQLWSRQNLQDEIPCQNISFSVTTMLEDFSYFLYVELAKSLNMKVVAIDV